MHLPQLITDLAYILGMAAFVTLVFRRLKQPVVLGYLLTGFIVGPHSIGPSIGDSESVKVWAELGIIFLMFSLGLEFSFKKLLRIGFPASVSGTLQIVLMMIIGYFCALSLGFGQSTAVFLGAMIAISSTTIIIKVFNEMELNTRRFADMVFGVLIVEDLAAILILVALSSFGAGSSLDALAVFRSAGQLIFVVSIWFLLGMIIVPKYMKSVGRHGTNELVVLSSVALCLGLVVLAAKFEYSVALGAFLMGSILAETRDLKRIERLIEPLKDIFGAVFFVSVGMMLDPSVVLDNWFSVVVISSVVIFGKIFSGVIGSLLAGQPLDDVVRISLSKAQIGEFSFIIAGLGVASGAMEKNLYPIIVATCVITTFLTPYLIKSSDFFVSKIPLIASERATSTYERYRIWFERQMATPKASKEAYRDLVRWLACTVIVVGIFEVIAITLKSSLVGVFGPWSSYGSWGVAFLVSAPFIWAMIFPSRVGPGPERRRSLRRLSVFGAMLAILLIGVLSREFLTFTESLVLTTIGVGTLLIVFRRQLEVRYRWVENQFLDGFQAGKSIQPVSLSFRTKEISQMLGPWDIHLKEVVIPVGSIYAGKTLASAQLREKLGVNVVCVERGERLIVNPLPDEIILPLDRLLVFGEDEDIANFNAQQIDKKEVDRDKLVLGDEISNYKVEVLRITQQSALNGKSIRGSQLRESFQCMVVGVERAGIRVKNPPSDYVLREDDFIWVVGRPQKLSLLSSSL